MERAIVGYHQDHVGDWVAELDCHHNQHVRNNPPFTARPWVESLAGRTDRLGSKLQCVRCDRLEMPEDLLPYKKTPEFTEISIPKGLLAQHSTKKGVWGRISLLAGKLEYTVEVPVRKTIELSEGQHANIPPEMSHCVHPVGKVRFYVELLLEQSRKNLNASG